MGAGMGEQGRVEMPDMGKQWQEFLIEELASSEPNALATGPFGSAISSKYFTDCGVPVIRGSNLSANVSERLKDEGIVFVSNDKAKEFRRSIASRGDLVFTCWGTINQIGFIDCRSRFEKYIISNKQMKLSVDRTKVDPLFLYYIFSGPEKQTEIIDNGIGSSVPGFNLGQLRKHAVLLPPLDEQIQIVGILGALDDRITLLRETNATLEGIIQELFKSWFVDFDPVRAKAEGRDLEGVPPEAEDLFPSEFENSELGAIPKGWRVASIKDLTTKIQYGLTQSASSTPVGPRFLRITDIQGGSVDWNKVPYCRVSEKEYSKYKILPHDILVARTGASTGENIYLFSAPDAVFASYLVRFQFPGLGIGRLVGAYMRTSAYFEYVASCRGGSAQPNASAQALAGARIVIPEAGVADQFAQLVAPMDQRIVANQNVIESLSDIRDTLLPRLMSGKLRISPCASGVEEML
jgi:type I restriction enzyme S subunit